MCSINKRLKLEATAHAPPALHANILPPLKTSTHYKCKSGLASGGAGGSIENIRAYRMNRLLATQRVSSANPEKVRCEVVVNNVLGARLDIFGDCIIVLFFVLRFRGKACFGAGDDFMLDLTATGSTFTDPFTIAR